MTDEQQAWLTKAQQRLQGAACLEAKKIYDGIADDAFFAMFYVAKFYLLERGLTFTRESSTISAFGQHCVKTGRVPANFQRHLLDAWAIRRQSEFSFGLPVPHTVALNLIEQAETFVREAEAVRRA